MIGYTTVGSNDLDRATSFYDALFAELGAKRIMEDPGNFIAWGVSMDQPGFSVTKPFNGEAATVGNGVMIALVVPSKEMVHKVYDKAMELGAQDEGPAGPRGDQFYAGYFRDLDGNKLNVFCMTQPE
jgi:predicted lactoylglutathione lyase